MRLVDGVTRTETISFQAVRNLGEPLHARMRPLGAQGAACGKGDPGAYRQELTPRSDGYGDGMWSDYDHNGDGSGLSASMSFAIDHTIGLLLDLWEERP